MKLPIEAIQDKLAQIETEENVTIFYSCESGGGLKLRHL